MEQYCEAVQLLLKRMDTNPEEFTFDVEKGGEWPDKWGRLIRDLYDRTECDRINEDYEERNIWPMVRQLTVEEHKALMDKLAEIQKGNLMTYVLNRVMDVPTKRRKA